MDPNIVFPFLSSALSLVFFAFLIDQWRERRRPYQAIWALGMLWYAIGAGTEWIGAAAGWSEPLYRVWYLFGAIMVAGWLGLGTASLLGRTRFGYAFALSFLLAGLFTVLTQAKAQYPDSGIAPLVYGAGGLLVAVAMVVLQVRGSRRWTDVGGAAIVGGSLLAAVLVAIAPLPAPGWMVAPGTGIPTGTLFPGYVRLLTPFFNITGAFALVLGALFSAYVFMPKRRVVRYRLDRHAGPGTLARGLATAVVAIPVNVVASIPDAVRAQREGRLDTRVPATILIAVGGLIPAITSGLNRFGDTSVFFLGELLGVVFLFAGFLVSIDVFQEVRIPFTHRLLWSRRGAGHG